MFKKIFVLVSLAAILGGSYIWFGKSSGKSTTDLIELSKSDPKAFDEYVQSRINAIEISRKRNAPADSAKPTPMTPEELIKQSETDPNAVTKFLNSHVQDQQPSTADKLLNFLAHGKYE